MIIVESIGIKSYAREKHDESFTSQQNRFILTNERRKDLVTVFFYSQEKR